MAGRFAFVAAWLATAGLASAAPPAVGDLARRIDARLAAAWKAEGVEPAPAADDATFLRRVSLDLIGRIPTPAEVDAYLRDRATDKRRLLVERLLASPGYARHWAAVWRHAILPQADTPQFANLGPAFEDWLRDELTAGTGHDRLARRLLTPAIGVPGEATLAFYAASEARPENLAANTARVFLGVNLDCAQCHNHPFARWTKRQFWAFAAFFAAPRDGRLQLRLPESEAVVPARVFLDAQPAWPAALEADTGRQVLAGWVTSPDNPFFARNAVNRVWAQLFGHGLVEPLDDLSEENPPSQPEVLDALARAFVESGHDVKYLFRVLTATRAYQLGSRRPAGKPDPAPELFARMPVRGLSAEQLYDTLRLATGEPLTAVGLEAPARRQFLARFHADRPATAQRSVLQALELMNGPRVREALATGKTLAAVADAPFLDSAGKVEALFLATLGRRPDKDEAAELVGLVDRAAEADRRKRLADVFWALLNSTEFSVNH